MAIPAFIEKVAPPSNRTRSLRRKLRLQVQGVSAGGDDITASVHNISATGLLLEGQVGLAVGDEIDILLPHAGATRAKVIWASDALYGCAFATPISAATLSAAQLRAAVGVDRDHDLERDIPNTESFGVRLHRFRTAKRLTQVQIAAEIGVSEQSISAWEQDKARPRAERIKALAALLGVEMTELLGIDEAESLHDVVARAKAQVAEVAAVSPDNVKIIIEI